MGIAWGAAFNLFHFLLKKFNIEFMKSKLFFLGLFVCAWVGAKVFFIITSQGLSSKTFVTSSNFWLGGGFVFYGGLIFGLLFLIIFQKKYKNSFKSYSILIPPLALGHGIGRIGCYFAGCCYGKYMNDYTRYPVQLFEASGLFMLSIISYYLIKFNRNVIGFYLVSYGFLRFVLEFYRGDAIRGIWMFGLSTSQIISIFLILLGIGIYIYRDMMRCSSS